MKKGITMGTSAEPWGTILFPMASQYPTDTVNRGHKLGGNGAQLEPVHNVYSHEGII